jgi:hypothetical protein
MTVEDTATAAPSTATPTSQPVGSDPVRTIEHQQSGGAAATTAATTDRKVG